ncbi:ZN292 protein, partial [Atractosteus spatula]|nr:ZN292 protein [Atractosteus spatula]
MADEEAERDHSPQIGTSAAIVALRERLQTLATELRDSREPAVQSAAQYCQDFCQVRRTFLKLFVRAVASKINPQKPDRYY